MSQYGDYRDSTRESNAEQSDNFILKGALCLPVEQVRQRISYEPETGFLYWRPLEEARNHDRHWNTRYAGTRALNTTVSKGYLGGSLFGRKFLAHRVCWAIYYGAWPDGQIDHINHDKKDNRISNLRSVTASENMFNRPDYVRLRRGGFQGIRKHRKSWIVTVRGYVGCFACIGEAVRQRDLAVVERGRHNA